MAPNSKRVFLSVLLALTASASLAQSSHLKPLRYPTSVAGIRVGKAFDADVVKRYGRGAFESSEGHLGGRYYTDPKHTITLHVVLGVDRLIEEVEVRAGLWLPKNSPVKQAETTRLDPAKIRISGHKLGDDQQHLLAKYGKGQKTTKEGGIVVVKYETDYHSTRDVLFYEAEFAFMKGRLVGARLYDGE